jgi:hypothetical protein
LPAEDAPAAVAEDAVGLAAILDGLE